MQVDKKYHLNNDVWKCVKNLDAVATLYLHPFMPYAEIGWLYLSREKSYRGHD